VSLSANFRLSSIMPSDKSRFYHYKGSLTTPPCSEIVTWLVFNETQTVTHDQMEKLRALYNNTPSLTNNFRTVKAMNERKVEFVTTPRPRGE